MNPFAFEDFKVGDMVTRDGTDVHRVVAREPGDNCMTVVCVVAPKDQWTTVGEEEFNLCRRYQYAHIDGEARRVSDTPLLGDSLSTREPDGRAD